MRFCFILYKSWVMILVFHLRLGWVEFLFSWRWILQVFLLFFLYGKEEIYLWDFFYIIRKLNDDNYFLFEVGLSCCHQDPIELGSAGQQDQLSLGSARPNNFWTSWSSNPMLFWLFCQIQGSWVWFGRQTQCYRVHLCS
jgi:hypothetical protein